MRRRSRYRSNTGNYRKKLPDSLSKRYPRSASRFWTSASSSSEYTTATGSAGVARRPPRAAAGEPPPTGRGSRSGRGRPCRRGRARPAGAGPSARCRAGSRPRASPRRGTPGRARSGRPSIRWSPVGPKAGPITELVVKSCRPIVRYRQSPEDDRQVGGEVGVRAVVQLVALVDPLDQRLARLGVGDRAAARP